MCKRIMKVARVLYLDSAFCPIVIDFISEVSM